MASGASRAGRECIDSTLAVQPTRAILLVADTRHDRAVIAGLPQLRREFPVGTRSALAALDSGRDPGADCLVIL
jgi:hypothetical protein